MNSKYYLLSFCAISISFACVSAQNLTCPVRISGPIADGVHAELIHSDSGLLLGIRVSWSWLSSDPVECFKSPEVELIKPHSTENLIRRTLDSMATSRNNLIEFNTTELDCNQMYIPRVRAAIHDISLFSHGNTIYFGGSVKSPPAIIPRVCVGPSTSPQHQGRVNISWDPLPCHLQNGADVTSYTIQYTCLSTGVATRITIFHSGANCREEVDGLYSCVVAESLIPGNQAYSIQVAAVNSYGEGSFSNPINITLPVSSTTCTNSGDAKGGIGSTTSGPIIDTSSAGPHNDMTSIPQDVLVSLNAWIVMGAVVAVIVVLAGIVITILLIIIYMLWKRLDFSKAEKEQSLQHGKSEGIDMKECSAYGQVISPQTTTEQPHIYESTT